MFIAVSSSVTLLVINLQRFYPTFLLLDAVLDVVTLFVSVEASKFEQLERVRVLNSQHCNMQIQCSYN
jgi:hypothetical protein